MEAFMGYEIIFPSPDYEASQELGSRVSRWHFMT